MHRTPWSRQRTPWYVWAFGAIFVGALVFSLLGMCGHDPTGLTPRGRCEKASQTYGQETKYSIIHDTCHIQDKDGDWSLLYGPSN